jgi:hypothetical protein
MVDERIEALVVWVIWTLASHWLYYFYEVWAAGAGLHEYTWIYRFWQFIQTVAETPHCQMPYVVIATGATLSLLVLGD